MLTAPARTPVTDFETALGVEKMPGIATNMNARSLGPGETKPTDEKRYYVDAKYT